MTKDSRLEKFLKALCSLDYSDLPTPLSRVEVLWNCLITGEATPDFQPQSRTEKYLMTILGVYDLEDIPKPISRAETLLYKLATGDTDVELEDGAKSRYELLLSEIVANGGVGDNVDFEYVTHILTESFNTLYNTVEAPVKSAILTGQTLVNILPSVNDDRFLIKNSTTLERLEDGFLRINAPHKGRWEIVTNTIPIKPSTKYLLITEVKNNTVDGLVTLADVTGFTSNNLTKVSVGFNGVLKQIITTKDVLYEYIFQGWLDSGSSGFVDIRNTLIEYQEGMENWDIPYFEGMQSVKLPVLTTVGKNLLEWQKLFTNELVDGYEINKGKVYVPVRIPVPNVNEQYTLVFSGKIDDFGSDSNFMKAFAVIVYYTDGTTSQKYAINDNTTLTTIKGKIIDRIEISHPFSSTRPDYTARIKDIALYQGSAATPYEPFKSNILTTNEEVELRGIGDVQDELDLLTGELTQRIGDVVLDGSEDWVGEYERFRLYKDNTIPNKWTNGISNHFIGNRGQLMSGADYDNYFAINGYGSCLYVRDINLFPNPKSQLNEFKSWLSERNAQGNPVVLQYCLSQGSIKTVDLTTLDQDGNKTKLKTFNDITHVSLSSEGLIPEAEMTVVTKILDDISQTSTMSLRMNDISDRQNELQNEVDTQSESIDSTMMATTEIYEQTL